MINAHGKEQHVRLIRVIQKIKVKMVKLIFIRRYNIKVRMRIHCISGTVLDYNADQVRSANHLDIRILID